MGEERCSRFCIFAHFYMIIVSISKSWMDEDYAITLLWVVGKNTIAVIAVSQFQTLINSHACHWKKNTSPIIISYKTYMSRETIYSLLNARRCLQIWCIDPQLSSGKRDMLPNVSDWSSKQALFSHTLHFNPTSQLNALTIFLFPEAFIPEPWS